MSKAVVFEGCVGEEERVPEEFVFLIKSLVCIAVPVPKIRIVCGIWMTMFVKNYVII